MKKILVVGLAMMMTLAACGGSGESTVSTAAGTDGTAVADESVAAQGALSPAAQNILGLLKLEDTELAVDPSQAETLLPLWQAYRSLLNSDTTAPAGAGALQAQINRRSATSSRTPSPPWT
jgi:hypothetical protein